MLNAHNHEMIRQKGLTTSSLDLDTVIPLPKLQLLQFFNLNFPLFNTSVFFFFRINFFVFLYRDIKITCGNKSKLIIFHTYTCNDILS